MKMFNQFIWMCFILLPCLDGLYSYSQYRNIIPNGNRVPHPCKNGTIWEGVGHQKSTGDGRLNSFGVDLKSSGFKWTRELCEKDSDGYGLTNGYELGDPNCTWTGDSFQTPDFDLSHPGICQPINDPKCELKQQWLPEACMSEDFKCKAIHEPGVKKIKLQFPLMDLPAQKTTYLCKEFDFTFIEDAHIIAIKILPNNTNVLHHTILFGCQTSNRKLRSDVFPCGMIPNEDCSTMIYLWGKNAPAGDCFQERSGFRIGRKGSKKVVLQIHWNNPTLRSDYTDASAIQIYYTTKKRQYDSGFIIIGPTYFEIPPKSPSAVITGRCPGSCTSRYMKDKIYIFAAIHHMHRLGYAGSIDLIRNGTKIREITNFQNITYMYHFTRRYIENHLYLQHGESNNKDILWSVG